MRSIMSGFMKRHLKVETWIGEKKIGDQQIDDPFITTRVELEMTFGFWELIKLAFTSRKHHETVRVHVVGDDVSMKRWFNGEDCCEHCGAKIGPALGVHETEPGYHHGDERICENCYYGFDMPKESKSFGEIACES